MTSQGAETVNLIDQHIDLMDTDEFRILNAGLWKMEICTSLSDSQAESRANLIPPKRNMLWAIIPTDTISCYHNRQTHRHMIMSAVTL
jgi:hypothetical protein